MSDGNWVIECWTGQIKALEPKIRLARMHGQRLRLMLYVGADVGEARLEVLPHGRLDKIVTEKVGFGPIE